MHSRSEVLVRVDGASRGNPGPAAFGVVMETAEGSPLTKFSKFLGQATNNFAEYQGLIAALEYALRHRYLRIQVLTDSELMARQIAGQYKVRSADLKPLHDQAKQLISRFEAFSIQHVPREQNRKADRLANQALNAAERGVPSEGLGFESPSQGPGRAPSGCLQASATFQRGVLKPRQQLPLLDGEEVDLVIRRKK